MVRHESQVERIDLSSEDIKNVKKQILIGPNDGFNGYFRVFSVGPGGNTPYHKHPWWHANYVLEGRGKIVLEGKDYPIEKGSVAFIEGNRIHQFINTGDRELRFICLVPPEGDSY